MQQRLGLNISSRGTALPGHWASHVKGLVLNAVARCINCATIKEDHRYTHLEAFSPNLVVWLRVRSYGCKIVHSATSHADNDIACAASYRSLLTSAAAMVELGTGQVLASSPLARTPAN